MTDKELRDAAVAELKLTTAGWRKPNGNPNYPSGTAPMSTHWGKAMSLLEQIGQAQPEPEPDTGTIYPVKPSDNLQARLDAIPSGTEANPSVVELEAGEYTVPVMLSVTGKQWWIVRSRADILGGDATLRWTIPVTLSGGFYQGDDSKRLLRFTDCKHMVLRCLKLVGASPMPASGDGFKPWEPSVQHMHSLVVSRCEDFTVQKVRIDGSGGGDAINWGNENSGLRSTGVIEDCDIRNAHRCTIALVGSGGLTIRRNVLARGGFWMIDLEPNTVESGNFNTVIEDNTFASQEGLLSRCAIGAFAGSKDGRGQCENVTIRNNTFQRTAEMRFNTNINGGYPYPLKIKNVRIEGNVTQVSGPQIECRQIDGLDVSGNSFGPISDPELGLWDCTGVSISGSTFNVYE
jgi:hypothetical protein